MYRLKVSHILSAIALIALAWSSLPMHQPNQDVADDDRAALIHALKTINTWPEERLVTIGEPLLPSEVQAGFCGTPLLAAEYVAEKLTGLGVDEVRKLAAEPSRYYTVPIRKL